MSVIDKKIAQILKDQQELNRVERHLQQLEARMESARRELKDLDDKLHDDYKDLEKLNKLSLRGVFYKVLGSKEEQLEKEKQEYLQAALKHNDLQKSIELMDFERNVLLEKLENFGSLERDLKKLMKQREKELIHSNSALGEKLLFIVQRTEKNEKVAREINEALVAGRNAHKQLTKMTHFMINAQSWGNWDVMMGDTVSSMVKHSNIDKARALAPRAKHLLLKFEDELRDVYRMHSPEFQHLEMGFHRDAFSHFTDIFFDNLISDWIVQQRIQNALSNLNAVKDKVKRLIMTLESEQLTIKRSNEELNRQKEDILKGI